MKSETKQNCWPFGTFRFVFVYWGTTKSHFLRLRLGSSLLALPCCYFRTRAGCGFFQPSEHQTNRKNICAPFFFHFQKKKVRGKTWREMSEEQHSSVSVVLASRRERLRRPLPNPPPPADQLSTNRGSSSTSGGGAAAAAAAAAGVRGVVASRLAAMASAGSSTSSSVTAASAGSSSPASTATTNGSDLPHKLSTSYSVDSNSRIPSYRLSSLDRLAQRQRLFEATTATSVQPNGLPTAHPPPPPTTAATTTTYAAAGETHGVSLLHYPVSYVSLVTWDDDTPFWPLGRPGCHAEPLSFSLFRMTADAPALRMRRTTTTTTIPRRRRRLVVTVVVVVYHRCAHPQPCTTTTGALIDLFTWPKKKKKKQSSSCGGSFAFSYSFHFVFHRRTLKAIHSIYLSLFRSLVGWGPLVIWESLRIWNYYTLYTRKIDAPRRVVNHSSAD